MCVAMSNRFYFQGAHTHTHTYTSINIHTSTQELSKKMVTEGYPGSSTVSADDTHIHTHGTTQHNPITLLILGCFQSKINPT